MAPGDRARRQRCDRVVASAQMLLLATPGHRGVHSRRGHGRVTWSAAQGQTRARGPARLRAPAARRRPRPGPRRDGRAWLDLARLSRSRAGARRDRAAERKGTAPKAELSREQTPRARRRPAPRRRARRAAAARGRDGTCPMGHAGHRAGQTSGHRAGHAGGVPRGGAPPHEGARVPVPARAPAHPNPTQPNPTKKSLARLSNAIRDPGQRAELVEPSLAQRQFATSLGIELEPLVARVRGEACASCLSVDEAQARLGALLEDAAASVIGGAA